MRYYFGFLPSDELSRTIDQAYALINSGSSERYDSYRDKIVHLTSRELLDALLVKLIESLPDDSERKPQLIKTAQTIESTTDKLINTILSPTDNKHVLPSFEFFDQQVLFTDPLGQRRIGLQLDDKLAKDLLACMERVLAGDGKAQVNELTRLFTQLAQACMQHFLVDFTKTLNLNMLKRAAIPMADGVINKVLDVAIHRLIPQLPQASLERFASYYQSLIIAIDE